MTRLTPVGRIAHGDGDAEVERYWLAMLQQLRRRGRAAVFLRGEQNAGSFAFVAALGMTTHAFIPDSTGSAPCRLVAKSARAVDMPREGTTPNRRLVARRHRHLERPRRTRGHRSR